MVDDSWSQSFKTRIVFILKGRLKELGPNQRPSLRKARQHELMHNPALI